MPLIIAEMLRTGPIGKNTIEGVTRIAPAIKVITFRKSIEKASLRVTFPVSRRRKNELSERKLSSLRCLNGFSEELHLYV